MRKMWKLLVYFIMRTFINRIQYVLYFLIPTTKNQCQCNGIDNKKSIVPSQNAPPINLIIIPFNNFIVCRLLKLHFITQIIKSKYYFSLNNVSIQFTMPQLSVLARFFSVKLKYNKARHNLHRHQHHHRRIDQSKHIDSRLFVMRCFSDQFVLWTVLPDINRWSSLFLFGISQIYVVSWTLAAKLFLSVSFVIIIDKQSNILFRLTSIRSIWIMFVNSYKTNI